jgi:hypothetical protein
MTTGRQFPYTGAVANDGTGDPLRDAFDIINRTTGELYDVAADYRGRTIKSRTVTAIPAGPIVGDAYIVPSNATGVWAAQTGKIAVYEGDSAAAGWKYYTPTDGRIAWVVDESVMLVRNGGAWVSTFSMTSGKFVAAFSAAALALLASVTPAEGTIPYFNSAASMSTTAISAAGRDLIAAATVPAQRDALGLGASNTVQHARVLTGASAGLAAPSGTPTIQAIGNSASAAMMAVRYSADAFNPSVFLAKSRGTTPTARVVVQAGDVLGEVAYLGDDGTALIPAASVRAIVDATPGASDMPGALLFLTTADGAGILSERMRIDRTGRVLVGHTAPIAAINGSYNLTTQIHGSTISSTGLTVVNWMANNSGGNLIAGKSRGAAPGTYVALQSGDALGNVWFVGDDGAALQVGARIAALADVAPTAGVDMPARLAFYTVAAGSLSHVERMRITSEGLVGIGATAPISTLHVAKADTTAFDASAADAQVGGGASLVVDQAGSNNTSFAQIVLKQRAASPSYVRLAAIGGTAPAFAITVGGAERIRIDTNRVIINNQTSIALGSSIAGQLQLHGTGGSGIGLSRWTNDVGGQNIRIAKSRGASIGTQGIVTSGDTIGTIGFDADDGAQFIPAAAILGSVDGTPGINDMPGRLTFWTTPDASAALVERMRIQSDGKVGIGTTAPTTLLDVNSDAIRVRTAKTPATAGAAGDAGTIAWDASYIYVCTATNTWKRAAIATW